MLADIVADPHGSAAPFPRIRIRILVADPDPLNVLDTMHKNISTENCQSYGIKLKFKWKLPVPTNA